MFLNYFKIALRNILKYQSYSIVNILGLAGSLAITILIVFYALTIVSIDKFHEDSDRIFFMYHDKETEAGVVPVYDTWWPMAEVAKEEFASIESFTRCFQAGEVWVKFDDKRFKHRLTWADSSFFTFFSFPLIAGDRETLLDDPMSVVISKDVAKKFFGEDEALGRVLNFGGSNRTVTGVIGEIPGNSSFDLEMVTPLTTQFVTQSLGGRDYLWGDDPIRSFIKLYHADEITGLREQTQLIMDKYVHEVDRGNVLLLPLSDYHNLFSDHQKYVYYLLFVALGILLIAAINYTNLATAQSLTRTNEVGVRKFCGATKSGLVIQFLCESLTLAFIAIALGGFIAEILLPLFSSLAGIEIQINFINNPELIIAILFLGGVVGIFAGSYPALYISSMNPSRILRKTQSKSGSLLFRNSLVVFQFSVAIFLLFAVTIISRQVRYMKTLDTRFDRNNVIAIPFESRNIIDETTTVQSFISFKNHLEQIPGVISVTTSDFVPSDHHGAFYNIKRHDNNEMSMLRINNGYIEENFFTTYGINVIAGRNFTANSQNDRENSVIVNEAAAKALGFFDPIGEKLLGGPSDHPIEIIGVVEDYNYSSVKEPVKPLVHFYQTENNVGALSVKINKAVQLETLEAIAKIWNSMNLDMNFEYFFPAKKMETLYAAEDNLLDILSFAAIFAIGIACLGLYSLASFTIALRTKEIAIRKVMGASLSRIMQILSSSYLKLILVSFLIAIPFCWTALSDWLEGFAFRIEIGWVVFLIIGISILVLSFLMVGIHSIKAGLSNPVDSLRAE